MARIQLFEFHDLPWFPQAWRDMLTDVLFSFSMTFDPLRPVVPRLKLALVKSHSTRIIDLGSGGSGPLPLLERQLAKEENYPVTILMTDKYPNLRAFQRVSRASGGTIGYIERPIDATDVPADVDAFRTLITTFHHFAPDAAKKIIKDAIDKKAGLGIFEYTERSLLWFAASLLSPLYFWVTAPFLLRPFTWGRFFWGYLLPVPVLLMIWDGIVSNFRTYSPAELQRLVDEADGGLYEWDIGRVDSFGAARVTYLIGVPRRMQEAAGQSGTAT
jgi:hypothetical protein